MLFYLMSPTENGPDSSFSIFMILLTILLIGNYYYLTEFL